VLSNIDAEHGLLGMLLNNNNKFDLVMGIITSKDFSYQAHGLIFDTIAYEINEGRSCNATLIANRFENDKRLEAVGGEDYIYQLEKESPQLNNIKDYAEAIAVCSYKRQVMSTIDNLKETIENPAEFYKPDELVNHLEGIIFNTFDSRETGCHLSDGVDDALDWIKDVQSGNQVNYKTGLTDLDATIGGLRPGGLYVLAGRPGMGKSALALNMAEHLSKDLHVKIFSHEMSARELAMRVIAGHTGVTVEAQLNGTVDMAEAKAIELIRPKLKALKLHLDDRAGVDVNYLVSHSRKFARKHKDVAIFIDYLGLIKNIGNQNKVHQIEEITNRLKGLAKELNAPVVLLSQLSRGVESRHDKRPILSDLRDSGAIEQDADVIMFAYREEYYLKDAKPIREPKDSDVVYTKKVMDWNTALIDSAGKAEILIRKNRQGRVGSANLIFNGERQRFENV